jgi:hypothetical protein
MIDAIKDLVQRRAFTFTDHALRQLLKRNISDDDVVDALLDDDIIEDYPNDKYGPSCLIYGRTRDGRILHVQCSCPPRVCVITTYQPNPDEWIDGRVRRPQ